MKRMLRSANNVEIQRGVLHSGAKSAPQTWLGVRVSANVVIKTFTKYALIFVVITVTAASKSLRNATRALIVKLFFICVLLVYRWSAEARNFNASPAGTRKAECA